MAFRAEGEGKGGPSSPLVRIGEFLRNLGNFARSAELRGTETERAERAEVALIRGIRREDLPIILCWASHPGVRGHLDPAPELPENWNDRTQLEEATDKLMAYYENFDFGERQKIMPMVAVNKFDELIAVGTIRWRGDPYVPKDNRIASIERVIVDPELHRRGIGTRLVATMIEYAFDYYTGYNKRGAEEIRAWIMTDQQASPWEENVNFLRKLGFQVVPTAPHWREYAAQRGISTGGRDATWYRLRKEWYEEQKRQYPYIKPCELLDISVLRSR